MLRDGDPRRRADLDLLGARVHELFLAQRRDEPEGERIDRVDVEARVAALLRREAPLLAPRVAAALAARLGADIAGLGPLDVLLADPSVTEVMVNGPDQIWIESGGAIRRVDSRISAAMIARCIERVIGPLGLRLDRTSPYVDARLPDGSRLNAVIAPLAVDGPYLTIRRFAVEPLPLAAFCDPQMEDLLVGAVRSRRSILVSGATGSGKTSLLNALAAAIPNGERIITIEDTAELNLRIPHVVRLEARNATVEGVGEVTVRDLVRNALRMRPDRIVVGEVRGAEALDMVQAMSTGHRGSLSTVHANGPDDALRRLEVMILMAGFELPMPALARLLAGAVDLVVQVERTESSQRRVAAVAEVRLGGDGVTTVPVSLDRTDRDR